MAPPLNFKADSSTTTAPKNVRTESTRFSPSVSPSLTPPKWSGAWFTTNHWIWANPLQNPDDWNFAPRLMQSFFRVTDNIWSIVRRGVKPILPVKYAEPKRTCSTIQGVKALERTGYTIVPGGGKGSHIKFKKSGSQMVILPANRENLSPGVAKNLVRAIGGTTLVDLQSFI